MRERGAYSPTDRLPTTAILRCLDEAGIAMLAGLAVRQWGQCSWRACTRDDWERRSQVGRQRICFQGGTGNYVIGATFHMQPQSCPWLRGPPHRPCTPSYIHGPTALLRGGGQEYKRQLHYSFTKRLWIKSIRRFGHLIGPPRRNSTITHRHLLIWLRCGVRHFRCA